MSEGKLSSKNMNVEKKLRPHYRHTRGIILEASRGCLFGGERYSFETRILPRSRFQTFRCPLRLLGEADAPRLAESGRRVLYVCHVCVSVLLVVC